MPDPDGFSTYGRQVPGCKGRKEVIMSNPFNFNGSFEDIIREIKDGVRDFARTMADESGSFEENFRHAGGDQGCCGNSDFSFRFGFQGRPRHTEYKNEDGSLVFEFLLPGFDESCIDLSFKGDMMILKATVPDYLRQKVREGNRPFVRDVDRREYSVPAVRYDQAAVKAVLKNGILTVTIPAREEDMSDTVKVHIVKEGN